jgi:heat shock protein HtpX
MKRVVLFVLTNLPVMVVLSIMLKVFGIDRAMALEGFNLGPLLLFSAVFGFGGAIMSLLISKPVAKWSTGAQLIDGGEGSTHRHAGCCDLRRRAERIRNRRIQETLRWLPSRPGSCSR